MVRQPKEELRQVHFGSSTVGFTLHCRSCSIEPRQHQSRSNWIEKIRVQWNNEERPPNFQNIWNTGFLNSVFNEKEMTIEETQTLPGTSALLEPKLLKRLNLIPPPWTLQTRLVTGRLSHEWRRARVKRSLGRAGLVVQSHKVSSILEE